MGKQKLTSVQVELIKYLLKENTYKHGSIGEMFNISREAVTGINLGYRWSEVRTPDDVRGKLLYYKLLNNELN